MDAADLDRAQALGTQLVQVHDELRESLDRLRDSLDSADDEPLADASVHLRSLQAHCLGFCAALTRHHGSEDEVMFPLLAEQTPELAPVLAELAHDHTLIADILRRVEQVAGRITQDGVARVRSELDGLSAILESHLRWEERRVVDALNALRDPEPSAAELFGAQP